MMIRIMWTEIVVYSLPKRHVSRTDGTCEQGMHCLFQVVVVSRWTMLHFFDASADGSAITLVSHFPMRGLARFAAISNALAFRAKSMRALVHCRFTATAAFDSLKHLGSRQWWYLHFLQGVFTQTKPKASLRNSAVADNVFLAIVDK
jgi:hypothetical protein